MDYGSFKAALGLLFFGSVFLFGLVQLAALRRDRRKAELTTERPRQALTRRIDQKDQ
jgi:CHASE1-domain containing sensor protein